VILEVELRTVPNARYRLEPFVIATEDYVQTYTAEVTQRSDARMAYGRLCIVPDRLFDEVILNVLREEPADGGPMPELTAPALGTLQRAFFRGSAEDDYGKRLRWDAEKRFQRYVAGKVFSRNQLLNDGVERFQNRSASSTDILHEYFIPPSQFRAFVSRMRKIIPRHQGNLLNVTVRNIYADRDAFLRYADQEMFAFVLLFCQQRTPRAEREAEAMSQELIDAALALGGRYYLPYRLHAKPQQFRQAYPRAQEFFERKRHYDPHELFQNEFYLKYGRT